jgi:transposase
MDELPDLSRLNVAEKDELIRDLWSLVLNLTAQVTPLQTKVVELEARLSQNSRNSSKPPSSDGLSKPKPKSLRQAGKHPTGGQKGHPGHTLKKVATPDRTEIHRPPPHCDACGAFLTEPTVVETRQVFDLPKLVLTRSPSTKCLPVSVPPAARLAGVSFPRASTRQCNTVQRHWPP